MEVGILEFSWREKNPLCCRFVRVDKRNVTTNYTGSFYELSLIYGTRKKLLTIAPLQFKSPSSLTWRNSRSEEWNGLACQPGWLLSIPTPHFETLRAKQSSSSFLLEFPPILSSLNPLYSMLWVIFLPLIVGSNAHFYPLAIRTKFHFKKAI